MFEKNEFESLKRSTLNECYSLNILRTVMFKIYVICRYEKNQITRKLFKSDLDFVCRKMFSLPKIRKSINTRIQEE